MTNPSIITNYQELITDISSEQSRLTEIYGKALATRPLSWFLILHDQFSLSGSVILLTGLLCGGVSLFFIRRTKTVKYHKGQISFPGGEFQVSDGSKLNTALREAEEEVGLQAGDVEILMPRAADEMGF